MTYLVRNAVKEDAKEMAILINYAGTSPRNRGLDIIGWEAAAEDGEDGFDYGAGIVSSEDDLFSYNNIRVVEVDGKIAAMSLCYETFRRTPEQMQQIHEHLRIFKELTNTIPGEFYLDSLAVLPDYRGQGYGRIMLEDSVEKARMLGYSVIYLIAFTENVAGVSLYEKKGFIKVMTKTSSGHPDLPYSGEVVLYRKDIR
jgi:ribosomal protein S18 acetylase RimI-like enzyme